MSIAPEQFWQDILPAAQEEDTEFDTAFPAHLEDGRRILLPIGLLRTASMHSPR